MCKSKHRACEPCHEGDMAEQGTWVPKVIGMNINHGRKSNPPQELTTYLIAVSNAQQKQIWGQGFVVASVCHSRKRLLPEQLYLGQQEGQVKVTLCPPLSRERWMLVFGCLSPFYSVVGLAHELVLPYPGWVLLNLFRRPLTTTSRSVSPRWF